MQFEYEPRLLEQHTIKFRFRIKDKGIFNFYILNDDKKYQPEENMFEVL
jgi:hypothetical protein